MTSIMKILMTLLTQTMTTLNRHSCAQLPGKFHDQGEIDQPPSKMNLMKPEIWMSDLIYK